MPQHCVKFTIVARGDSEESLEEALHEAPRRVKSGNLSGVDQNDRGGFYFDSTTDVPAADQPA